MLLSVIKTPAPPAQLRLQPAPTPDHRHYGRVAPATLVAGQALPTRCRLARCDHHRSAGGAPVAGGERHLRRRPIKPRRFARKPLGCPRIPPPARRAAQASLIPPDTWLTPAVNDPVGLALRGRLALTLHHHRAGSASATPSQCFPYRSVTAGYRRFLPIPLLGGNPYRR